MNDMSRSRAITSSSCRTDASSAGRVSASAMRAKPSGGALAARTIRAARPGLGLLPHERAAEQHGEHGTHRRAMHARRAGGRSRFNATHPAQRRQFMQFVKQVERIARTQIVRIECAQACRAPDGPRRRGASSRSGASSTNGAAANRSNCGVGCPIDCCSSMHEVLARGADHRRRHAGQLRHLQAVALGRRALAAPRAGTRCRRSCSTADRCTLAACVNSCGNCVSSK